MVVRVQSTGYETGIYGADDKIFEVAGSGEGKRRLKFWVGQVGRAFGKGEEGELAKFKGLGRGESGERGVAGIVKVCAIAKDFKE